MRFTLRTRLLLFTLGIVVVLVGLSLWIVRDHVEGQVAGLVSADLDRTGSVFLELMRERADLESQARTVTREARQFQSILASDLFVVANRDGHLLARLQLNPVAPEHVHRVSAEGTAAGARVWNVDGQTYRLVAVEDVADSEGAVRMLGVGYLGDVDDAFAADVESHLLSVMERPQVREMLTSEVHGIGLMRALQRSFVADLFVVERGSQPLDGVVRVVSHGLEAPPHSPLRQALSGTGFSGLHADRGRLYHMTAEPVWSQDELVGALGTGFEIDDHLADNLQSLMHGEVSFFLVGGPSEPPRLVASTLGKIRREALAQQLMGGKILPWTPPFEVVLGDETFLSVASNFASTGDERGLFLIQHSLDEAVAFLDTLERALLALGVGGFLLAAMLSFVGARRFARPLAALVDGTRHLASGQLSHRIRVRTRSELGDLAESFNEMAAALEASESAYRDLFDNAQDVVFTADTQLRLTSMNGAGLEFFGCEMTAIVDDRCWQSWLPNRPR